jgi:hypothetical protein
VGSGGRAGKGFESCLGGGEGVMAWKLHACFGGWRLSSGISSTRCLRGERYKRKVLGLVRRGLAACQCQDTGVDAMVDL